MKFSNWNLVLESCGDKKLLEAYFDAFEEDALLIVQIDTAERGEVGYDITKPFRTKDTDWKEYSYELRKKVIEKISRIIPEEYQLNVAYAVAVEETDAWLIPLFDGHCKETAQYANPKEQLRRLIGRMDGKKKHLFINAAKKNLDYGSMGKEMKKELRLCRKNNASLDFFCRELEEKIG